MKIKWRESSGSRATYRTRTSQRTPPTSRENPMGGDVISSQKAPLGACTHPSTSPSGDLRLLWVTFHNVISGQKAPLGRILSRDFRQPCRSCAVTHFVLLLQQYHYSSKKKARECTSGHAQNILPDMMSLPVRASSGHVTSGQGFFRSRDFWEHLIAPPQM